MSAVIVIGLTILDTIIGQSLSGEHEYSCDNQNLHFIIIICLPFILFNSI